MSAPAAVLFDNDGLLLDTESVWTRGEQDLFERHGRQFTLADKQELVGAPAHVAGEVIARKLDQRGRAEELIAELDELVLAELENGIEAMVGARELVAELASRGVPLALVTNSPPRFVGRALELVGMERAFDTVVSGHDVAAPKPEPDPYLRACELLGAGPPGAFALEDSPTGVRSAVAAGLTVIGVPSIPGVELEQAHIVVGSLADPALPGHLGLSL